MSEPVDKTPDYVWKARAEAAKADALLSTAKARRALAEAEKEELVLDSERIVKAELLASDDYNHVFRFSQQVDSGSVQRAINRLNVWRRVDPGCDITLIFTSPGGDVVSGMAFYDYLQDLKANGHRLTTVAQGMAASMAGILLQAGDVRVIGHESYLLIHQVQAGMMGSFGDLQDRMRWLDIVQDRILDIFAARSKLSRAKIKVNWTRTDWWIDSAKALEYGFVDQVR